MQIVVGTANKYFSSTISEILSAHKVPCIRTAKPERLLNELKKPKCLLILDMDWDKMQEHGVLKQMVNIGKISGNRIICICANKEESQKKLAKAARPEKVFIHYDIHADFKKYLLDILGF